MVDSIHEYRLEDCMDAIIDYRGKTPKKTASGIPLITAKIIKDGRIQDVTEFIAEEDYESWMRRGVPEPGDIVLTTEAPLGEVAQLDDRKIALAQRVITLRGKEGLLNNDYLKYLLLSNEFQHQLDGRGTGTTVKGIKQSELRNIVLRFPDIDTQKSTAYVLKILDSKIELNRQTNQTLEQMAQALFKSWFVDFDPVIDNALAAGNKLPDELAARVAVRQRAQKLSNFKPLPADIQKLFPSEFEQTDDPTIGIDGWIPKGWKKDTLMSFGKVVTGKTPPSKVENAFGVSGIPFITPTDVDNDVYVLSVGRALTDEGINAVKNNVIDKGSVCVTCIGSQMGKTVIAPSKAVTNQQLNSIILSDEFSRNYIFMNLRARREELFNLGSSGSTMPILNKSSFENLAILRPSDDVVKTFSKFTENQLEKILVNSKQNKLLERIRDTLLPKLISGEITINKDIKNESLG